MTWEIFLGISALIGFIGAICGPMLKLSKTLTLLNSNLNNFKETLSNLIAENAASHKRIWDAIESGNKVLDSHEKRLMEIEIRMEYCQKNMAIKQQQQNRGR